MSYRKFTLAFISQGQVVKALMARAKAPKRIHQEFELGPDEAILHAEPVVLDDNKTGHDTHAETLTIMERIDDLYDDPRQLDLVLHLAAIAFQAGQKHTAKTKKSRIKVSPETPSL